MPDLNLRKLPDPNRTFDLKVLSNEKRGNLKVVAFDRSPFKLFTLRFSNKSMQAPSCERPRTDQRTLFLSFESNNCFPITVSDAYEKIWETCMPRGKFKHRYWFFAETPNVAWIVSVILKDLLFKSDLYRLFKHRGGYIIPLFQISV